MAKVTPVPTTTCNRANPHDRLGDDAFLLILGKLDPRDLVAASQVSRSWRHLLVDSQSYTAWRRSCEQANADERDRCAAIPPNTDSSIPDDYHFWRTLAFRDARLARAWETGPTAKTTYHTILDLMNVDSRSGVMVMCCPTNSFMGLVDRTTFSPIIGYKLNSDTDASNGFLVSTDYPNSVFNGDAMEHEFTIFKIVRGPNTATIVTPMEVVRVDFGFKDASRCCDVLHADIWYLGPKTGAGMPSIIWIRKHCHSTNVCVYSAPWKNPIKFKLGPLQPRFLHTLRVTPIVDDYLLITHESRSISGLFNVRPSSVAVRIATWPIKSRHSPAFIFNFGRPSSIRAQIVSEESAGPVVLQVPAYPRRGRELEDRSKYSWAWGHKLISCINNDYDLIAGCCDGVQILRNYRQVLAHASRIPQQEARQQYLADHTVWLHFWSRVGLVAAHGSRFTVNTYHGLFVIDSHALARATVNSPDRPDLPVLRIRVSRRDDDYSGMVMDSRAIYVTQYDAGMIVVHKFD